MDEGILQLSLNVTVDLEVTNSRGVDITETQERPWNLHVWRLKIQLDEHLGNIVSL